MTTTPLDADLHAAQRLQALVPQLVETRRELARLQAREARLLADAERVAAEWASEADARSQADLTRRAVAAEIAAALRVSDRTVQRELDEARTLVHDFPQTLAALDDGRISRAHVRVIVGAGALVERPELRAAYEDSVLGYAESSSASRLAPIAKRRAEWFAETTIDDRHASARETRCVSVHDVDDGMSVLTAVLPSVLAHGVHGRLSALAHAVAGTSPAQPAGPPERPDDPDAPDTRTIDQLRADIFCDLLLAGDTVGHDTPTGAAAIRAHVQVTIPVLRLVDGDAADPFEATTLDRVGPIDPATARLLAADAPGWDRILTHPITGAVLAVDRYEPSSQMRRHLRVRDAHCRFPGCRADIAHCDLDHTIDHARGGPTDVRNLAHLCRRHHVLKHQTAWSVRQLPGGVLEWTSPAGTRHTDAPVSTVAFTPDPECEPVPF